MVEGAIGDGEKLAFARGAIGKDFAPGAGVGCLVAGDLSECGVEGEITVVGGGDGLVELAQGCGAVGDGAVRLHEVGVRGVCGD